MHCSKHSQNHLMKCSSAWLSLPPMLIMSEKLWPFKDVFSSECVSNYIHSHSLHGAKSFLRSYPVLSESINSPTLYGTRRFITAFTSSCHLSHSWARSNQFMAYPYPMPWTSILIILSHLRLGFPNLVPSVSPPKHCMHLSCPFMCYMPHPSHTWSPK